MTPIAGVDGAKKGTRPSPLPFALPFENWVVAVCGRKLGNSPPEFVMFHQSLWILLAPLL